MRKTTTPPSRRRRLSALSPLLPVLLAVALLAVADRAPALDTKTASVGPLTIVTETEGPYVASGDQAFALPSIETAVAVTNRDFEALRRFLKRHCRRKGCVLTYETETRTVLAVKAPTGRSFLVPYTERAKRAAPGTPRTVRTVLYGWSHDTYNLTARTKAGNYCIPNDYAWKDYADRAGEALTAFGDQEASLAALVEVTVYPLEGDASEDCAGFLGAIAPAR